MSKLISRTDRGFSVLVEDQRGMALHDQFPGRPSSGGDVRRAIRGR